MLTARSSAGNPPMSGRAKARVVTSAAVCAAAVALTVAGCGSVAAPGTAGTSGHTGTSGTAGSAAKAPKVSVNLSITHGAGTKAVHWTLRCEPAGGTDPDPAAACKTLLGVKDPFAAAPRRVHVMCPMILASAEQVTVTGTWFGQKVHRVIVDGGCDIGLWSEIGQVFH
jgi:subtilisin inhibitor-like